ncbi:hypothetical protein ACSBR2_001451 [Camellia fascicularis]
MFRAIEQSRAEEEEENGILQHVHYKIKTQIISEGQFQMGHLSRQFSSLPSTLPTQLLSTVLQPRPTSSSTVLDPCTSTANLSSPPTPINVAIPSTYEANSDLFAKTDTSNSCNRRISQTSHYTNNVSKSSRQRSQLLTLSHE